MGIFGALTDIAGFGQDRRAASRLNQRNIQASQLDYERSKEFAQNSVQWRTEDAQAAGIHPLFAMGASAQSFQPGYSSGAGETGSAAGNAIRRLGTNLDEIREDWLEAQIENTKAKTESIRSNAMQDTVIPVVDKRTQEIEKGRVTPFFKDSPEQSLNIKSPMTRVRIGSQEPWVPVEEMDEFMENPLAVGALTFIYKGNRNIDWAKLANEYVGTTKSSPWKRALISKVARSRAKLRKKRKPKNYYSPSIPKPRRR